MRKIDFGRFYKSLYEESPICIALFDKDGKLIHANKACVEILGCSDLNELHGINMFTTIHIPEEMKEKIGRQEYFKGEMLFDFDRIREANIYKPTREGKRHLCITVLPIFDDRGKFQGYVFQVEDIHKDKVTQEALAIQRDLALKLSSTSDLNEAMSQTLDVAIEISNSDCGGIYFFDDKTGVMYLMHHKGLTDEFVEVVRQYEPDSEHVRLVKSGKKVYGIAGPALEKDNELFQKEGLKTIGIFPIYNKEEIIGCLNLSSHTNYDIPFPNEALIESITVQIGSVFMRCKTEKELREIRNLAQMYFDIAGVMFVVLGRDQTVKHINKRGCGMLGYKEEEIIGKNWFDNFLPSSEKDKVKNIFNSLINDEIEPIDYFENPIITKKGEQRIIAFFNTVIRDENNQIVYTLSSGGDITDQKQSEREREVTVEILRLINTQTNIYDFLKQSVKLLRDWSDYEAVGIRLKAGSDFPYFDFLGFERDFIQRENRLCIVNNKGEIVKDEEGNPILECMCGKVITGKVNPSKPYFSKKGSFWTNSTSDLLATALEDPDLSNLRNHCNAEGYESVALIPLRFAGETHGLIQFCDKKRGLFSSEKISLLERLADSLGIALSHKKIEQNYKKLFEQMIDGFAVHEMIFDDKGKPIDYRFLSVNPGFEDLTGLRADNIIGKTVRQILPKVEDYWIEIYGQVVTSGIPVHFANFSRSFGRYFEVSAYRNAPGQFATIFTDITEKKRIEDELKGYQSKLQALAVEVSLAEERERRRIAAEIHDRISQALAFSNIKIGMLSEKIVLSENKESLAEIQGYIEQAIKDTRSLTFELSPPMLYELGFEAAVEWLVENFGRKNHIEATYEDDGSQKKIDENLRVIMFQSIREILNNVAKHAKARKVDVKTWKDDDFLCASINDDGEGFEPSQIKLKYHELEGYGLFNIRERFITLGGGMEVDSKPGKGTKIMLKAPIKQTR